MIDVMLEEELANKNDDDIFPPVELVRVEVVKLNDDLPLPMYQSTDAAGIDLYAAISTDMIVPCGGRAVIPSGIKVSIPIGYEMQIRPRSGLAAKYGITVCNAPGTVDCGFIGEIGIILINHGNAAFVVKRGDRIAQAVLNKIYQVNFVEVDELSPTSRGDKGFGSTGTQ